MWILNCARPARSRPCWTKPAPGKIRTIVSFHDFNETPSRSRLDEIARAARSLGADLLKIATRTDTSSAIGKVAGFFCSSSGWKWKSPPWESAASGELPGCEFARRGSALNYAHLGTPAELEGQLSISTTAALQPVRTSSLKVILAARMRISVLSIAMDNRSHCQTRCR